LLPQIEKRETLRAYKKKYQKLNKVFNAKNQINNRIQEVVDNRQYKAKYEALKEKRIMEKSAKNVDRFNSYL